MELTAEQEVVLNAWAIAQEKAAKAKKHIEEELELRKKAFAVLFPSPEEGTNTLELEGGWKLKGAFKLDRKVDEAALPAVQIALREKGFNPDLLVEWKPSVKVSMYRELTTEQMHIFDQALIVKPSTPTMELVAPKGKK